MMNAVDLEQEQEVLLVDSATAGTQRFSIVRRVLPLTAALVLVFTATFVVAPSRDAGHQEIGGPSKLSGLIQAYALEKGRALSESEVQSIYTHVAKGPKAKVLLAKFSQSEDSEKANALEEGLSEACSDAIAKKLKGVFAKFAKELVDLFFECMLSGDASEECEAADEKVENFMPDVVADCQASGDYCNISATDVVDGNKDTWSQAVCVPSECHREVTKTIEFLKEELGEELADTPGSQEGQEGEKKEAEKVEKSKDSDGPSCANCTLNVKCAGGQLSNEGPIKGEARAAAIFLVNMGNSVGGSESA